MFGNSALARSQVPRQQTGIVQSRPAPVGGWNARDALANMPPTDAPIIINWWPTPANVQLRQGYLQYATGFPSQVETVAGYKGDTQSKLFAAAGGNIYDATAGGAIGAAVQSGLGSNRWEFVNFTTTGGTRYLTMFNGVDKPRYWDGATWIAIDGGSTPAITFTTGAATTQLFNCTSHKSFLWVLRKNTLEAYYLPVGTVGGAAALYDLRPIFKRGGVLLDVETWSVDTGTGLDDRLVFASDQGEIAIFQGTNPASATTWSLAGVYYVGGVIGQRCLAKLGGDVLVICQYGLLPLSSLLQSKVINEAQTLTDKIQYATSQAISAGGANFGWQALSYPKTNMLLLNVATSGTTWVQYAMNTITGAWTQFTGWSAECWEIYNDDPYFGGPTYVGKAWANYDDAGSNIVTDLECAFDTMGAAGQLKQFTMVRPIIASDGNPGIVYGINIDFDQTSVVTSPSFSPSTLGSWDTSNWDSGIWGGGLTIQKGWQWASGLGYWGALRMATSSRGTQVQFSSVDYLFEPGGVL
jgi:hypothetical protein